MALNGKGEKNRSIRIGSIGCGGIASQKHLPALKNQAHRAELAAFCDLISQRAEKAAVSPS